MIAGREACRGELTLPKTTHICFLKTSLRQRREGHSELCEKRSRVLKVRTFLGTQITHSMPAIHGQSEAAERTYDPQG
eukprot:908546-Pleurochrysis_carterae.AAC.1